jgi:hypothetical protein
LFKGREKLSPAKICARSFGLPTLSSISIIA